MDIIFSILAIAANIIIMVVLKLELFTDTATMPDGDTREWHWSAFDRLNVADKNWLGYLQIALVAISVISCILVLVGVKHNVVKIIRLVSTICSAVVFAIILIVSFNTHPRY